MTKLEEQIKVVAEARATSLVASDKKKLSQMAWEQENLVLLNDVATKAQVVSEEETKLHNLTLQDYAENGNKKPAVGVGIREVTTYSYDADEAFKWAVEHKMALKLDETKFKNHVKADPPDFVTVITEPQATIATDLNEWLKENE